MGAQATFRNQGGRNIRRRDSTPALFSYASEDTQTGFPYVVFTWIAEILKWHLKRPARQNRHLVPSLRRASDLERGSSSAHSVTPEPGRAADNDGMAVSAKDQRQLLPINNQQRQPPATTNNKERHKPADLFVYVPLSEEGSFPTLPITGSSKEEPKEPKEIGEKGKAKLLRESPTASLLSQASRWKTTTNTPSTMSNKEPSGRTLAFSSGLRTFDRTSPTRQPAIVPAASPTGQKKPSATFGQLATVSICRQTFECATITPMAGSPVGREHLHRRDCETEASSPKKVQLHRPPERLIEMRSLLKINVRRPSIPDPTVPRPRSSFRLSGNEGQQRSTPRISAEDRQKKERPSMPLLNVGVLQQTSDRACGPTLEIRGKLEPNAHADLRPTLVPAPHVAVAVAARRLSAEDLSKVANGRNSPVAASIGLKVERERHHSPVHDTRTSPKTAGYPKRRASEMQLIPRLLPGNGTSAAPGRRDSVLVALKAKQVREARRSLALKDHREGGSPSAAEKKRVWRGSHGVFSSGMLKNWHHLIESNERNQHPYTIAHSQV